MSVVSEGVSVIVVNYKTPYDLEEFGESFLQQDYPSTLVVVNVSPEPGDVQVAEDLVGRCFGPAKYVEFENNCGYAAAVNYGASITNEPIIVAFNADIVIYPGGLEVCSERLLQNADWGVLGPIQLDQDGRLTHSGIFGTQEKPSFEGSWHQPPEEKHRVVREAISVSGSAYFIRRSLWDELTSCPIYQEIFPDVDGAFLPTNLYYEETGCSYHAASHGYKVIYDGTVDPFIHKWHRSVIENNMESQAGRWMNESLGMFRTFCDAHSIPHE